MYPNKNSLTMLTEKLKANIASYPDFPKKGILFRDICPLLQEPNLLHELIIKVSKCAILPSAEAIVAIDARGFIFGSLLANKLRKPLILARKKDKLPGEIFENEYALEYGKDYLAIQKQSIEKYKKFVIVDDLLATGGTAKCVADLLTKQQKEVLSLIVIIELRELKGREILNFPVHSQVIYD